MNDPQTADLLYGYGQIGAFLGLAPRQAEYLAQTKELPTFKLGRSVCARRAALTEWLAKREQEGAGMIRAGRNLVVNPAHVSHMTWDKSAFGPATLVITMADGSKHRVDHLADGTDAYKVEAAIIEAESAR